MNSVKDILLRISHKWAKLRLQPIRVFCMHHVCAEFDAESMNVGDWMQIDMFKNCIMAMQFNGVQFISLTEAYHHIVNDKFRHQRYAVLTFDDGYASLKEILPWLEEKHIPATIFINGKYLDGLSYRKNAKERYLTEKELYAITSPLIEIGSHGWEHVDARKFLVEEFEESVTRNDEILSSHPRYISFYAYAYGSRTSQEDRYLHSINFLPVLIDNQMNYNDNTFIHRELLK